jgi:predicted short-subunit dehydrogenase-like oxidoreductase (DUF2520 family)
MNDESESSLHGQNPEAGARKSDGVASGDVVIIGGGRVGSALAQLSARRGAVTTLWSRRALSLPGVSCHSGETAPQQLAAARLVVVAVRDEAITPVARTLRSQLELAARPNSIRLPPAHPKLPVVVHLSGAHPSEQVLEPLAGLATLGTMHPLVAVRSAEQGVELMPRAFWALEGSDTAVAVCAEMIDAIGARWVRLEAEDLALYHACAVIASNHAVALWTAARDALRRLGSLDPATATQMLLPLLQSTLDNVRIHGLPEALTGPVRRGDAATLRRHIAALSQREPGLLPSYRADAELARVALGRDPEDGLNLAMMQVLEEE